MTGLTQTDSDPTQTVIGWRTLVKFSQWQWPSNDIDPDSYCEWWWTQLLLLLTQTQIGIGRTQLLVVIIVWPSGGLNDSQLNWAQWPVNCYWTVLIVIDQTNWYWYWRTVIVIIIGQWPSYWLLLTDIIVRRTQLTVIIVDWTVIGIDWIELILLMTVDWLNELVNY